MLSLELEESLQSRPVVVDRLLAGPDQAHGQERLDQHLARLRRRPEGGAWLLGELERSGLRGRGGAWFPTWRKWAAVGDRSGGRAVVVVNATEGEPLSAKDKTLLARRPHLVLDGAALAAETVAAGEIVVCLSAGSRVAERAVRKAVGERRRARLGDRPIRIVTIPHRYISGESSALVQWLSGGPAKPQFTPPHVSQKGVDGLPTLVQNAETLANVALIARSGSTGYRELGTATSPGTTLMTLSGNVRRPGVYEVQLGARLGDVLDAAGGVVGRQGGALLGGYFGSWLAAESLFDVPLDAELLRAWHGASLGCGVLAVLPEGGCGVEETARILAYLAGETAGQCGPCVFGLRAISETMDRVASSTGVPTDLARLREWSGLVRGRGACRHPDGAAGHLASALSVFADHVEEHLAGVPCAGRRIPGFPRPPRRSWWR